MEVMTRTPTATMTATMTTTTKMMTTSVATTATSVATTRSTKHRQYHRLLPLQQQRRQRQLRQHHNLGASWRAQLHGSGKE
jgi:hypothetical protein